MNRGISILSLCALLGLALPAQAKMAVTLWTSTPDAPTFHKMVLAFERAHPDITLEAVDYPPASYLKNLRSAAASGTMPDVIGLAPGAETQLFRGTLIDLHPVADGVLGKEWESMYPAPLLDEARLGNPPDDGSFYMLPMTTALNGLWLGKDAARKAGIGTPPRTMKELVEDAGKLRQAGMSPLVMDGASDQALVRLFLQIIAAADMKLLLSLEHGSPMWTHQPVLSAATVWKQIFSGGLMANDVLGMSRRQAEDAYLHGKAGMIVADSSLLGVAWASGQAAAGSFFTFPAIGPSGVPAPPLGGISVGWAITRSATGQENVKIAAETVLHDFLVGGAAQEAIDDLSGFPAAEKLEPRIKPKEPIARLYAALRKQVADAHPDAIGNAAIARKLGAELRLLAEGKQQPDAAMRAVNGVASEQHRLNE